MNAAARGIFDASASAKTDAEKAAAAQRLADAQRQQAAVQRQIGAMRAAPQPGGNPRPRPACTCQAGDPLCSCL